MTLFDPDDALDPDALAAALAVLPQLLAFGDSLEQGRPRGVSAATAIGTLRIACDDAWEAGHWAGQRTVRWSIGTAQPGTMPAAAGQVDVTGEVSGMYNDTDASDDAVSELVRAHVRQHLPAPVFDQLLAHATRARYETTLQRARESSEGLLHHLALLCQDGNRYVADGLPAEQSATAHAVLRAGFTGGPEDLRAAVLAATA